MAWYDLIREARAASGLSQKALAERVGVSQPLIAKIERGLIEKTDYLPKIIEALNLNKNEFSADLFDIYGTKKSAYHVYQGPAPAFARDPAYWAAAAGLIGDVPLYASAEGGTGALIIEGDAIGNVKRPPALQGVKDGYAMYLVGSSMIPEFEPADIVFIHPRMPVLPGISCVFYSSHEDEPRAMVKRLLAVNDETWRVKQFNPEETFELSRAEWPTRHRIVSKTFRGSSEG